MLMFEGLFQTKSKAKNPVVVDTTGLDMNNIPQHIAIIMDGNGRWRRLRERCVPLVTRPVPKL